MEEEQNGERGKMLTYYRRRRRVSEIAEILTYYRRREREGSGEGSHEREDVVHESNSNWGREGGGISVSLKEERAVKKERAIDWCHIDVWTEVAKHLGAKELIKVSFMNQWFNSLFAQDYIWKYAFLRDMQIPVPCRVSFPWKEIYASAFNGSHSFRFREQNKHIDWRRMGSFYLNSPFMLLTETLSLPERLPKPGTDAKRSIELSGMCAVSNARTGIWIADLQLVCCECEVNGCDGTTQVLDARHVELFLEEGFLNKTWKYEEIGNNRIPVHSDVAFGGIFDLTCLCSSTSATILNANSWAGPPTLGEPKAKIWYHGVAVNTNLEPNDGILVRYQVMKDNNGKVVSIRISHQLL